MLKEYIMNLVDANQKEIECHLEILKKLEEEYQTGQEWIENLQKENNLEQNIFSPRIAATGGLEKLAQAQIKQQEIESKQEEVKRQLKGLKKKEEEYEGLLREADTQAVSGAEKEIPNRKEKNDTVNDTNFKERENKTTLVSDSEKTEGETMLRSDSEKTESETMLRSDSEKTEGETMLRSDSEKTESETMLRSDSEKTEGETMLRSDSNKTERETIRSSDSDKIENEAVSANDKIKKGIEIFDFSSQKDENKIQEKDKKMCSFLPNGTESCKKIVKKMEDEQKTDGESNEIVSEKQKVEFITPAGVATKTESENKAVESVTSVDMATKTVSQNKAVESAVPVDMATKTVSQNEAVESAAPVDIASKIREALDRKNRLMQADQENEILHKQIEQFHSMLTSLYRQTELCMALMNGDRNKCKSEMRELKKMIKKYSEMIK